MSATKTIFRSSLAACALLATQIALASDDVSPLVVDNGGGEGNPIVSVPEPGMLSLMAGALLVALAVWMWRRRRA
jgi:hypothetical protein